MNKFSDMKLVSFGDSYTFGHNSTLEGDYDRIVANQSNKNDHSMARIKWRNISNSNSYTAIISNRLNFKEYHNLGIPGSSNKSTLDVLRSYIHNNDVRNCFMLINMTFPDRDLIYTLNERINKSIPYYYQFGTWERDINSKPNLKITKMNKHSLVDMIEYYYNNITILFQQIHLYYSIIDCLKIAGVPYIIFDILNDMPFSNRKYDILNKCTSSELIGDFFGHEKFTIKQDIIERYFDDMENKRNPYYLNAFAIQDYKYYLNTNVPIEKHISNLIDYVSYFPGKTQHIMSPVKDDVHWNVYGHNIASGLLEHWIRKHYE